jgi:peptide/nickel transport system permease protein
MIKYLLKRVVISIPVFLGITMIIYGLIELAPGDIADFFVSAEGQFSAEDQAALRARFGLDQPVHVRYLNWLLNTLRGDLGFRFIDGQPVAAVLAERLQPTLVLMGTAVVIGVVVGVALGVFTALRQYSIWDIVLTGVSFVGISMPAFVMGLIGLFVFSLQLRLFPTGGMRPVDRDPTFWDWVSHLALPSLILALGYIATFMRYMRFSMLDVIRSDYLRTARAKGLRMGQVNWRHAFPNALLPVITVIGLSLPTVVVGAVFTETIFSWPGMGTLYIEAVSGRDVPLIMGINLVVALVVLAANLLTDIAYAVIDPRIRYD